MWTRVTFYSTGGSIALSEAFHWVPEAIGIDSVVDGGSCKVIK